MFIPIFPSELTTNETYLNQEAQKEEQAKTQLENQQYENLPKFDFEAQFLVEFNKTTYQVISVKSADSYTEFTLNLIKGSLVQLTPELRKSFFLKNSESLDIDPNGYFRAHHEVI